MRCSTRRWRVRASRSSLYQRSDQRAWSSRSGQAWHGCSRSRRRRASTSCCSGDDASSGREAGGRRRHQPVRDRAQRRGEVAAHLRVACVELPRQADPCHGGDRRREVDQAEPARLTLGGQHLRTWSVVRRTAAVEHDREAGELPGRHLDHVAAVQVGQGRDHLLAPARLAGARHRLLEVGDPVPQRGVLHEVAAVAGRRLGVPPESVLALRQLPGQPDHGLVGLELRERHLQQLTGALAAHLLDQVDRHVVRRSEARAERVGTRGRQAGDLRRVDARLPEHHRMPLDVEPATSGPAGQLGVLPRGDVGVGLAVPLRELLEHDRAGRHVDAEGQGLGGEDGLHQPPHEELLDALLEDRQHSGVVGRDAAREALEEVVVAQDVAVLVGKLGAGLLDIGDDLVDARRPW